MIGAICLLRINYSTWIIQLTRIICLKCNIYLRMHKNILLFLLVFFVSTLFACSGDASGEAHKRNQPMSIDGFLDLSEWNFERDGPINLNGEWEFYWKQLIEPSQFTESKVELSQFSGSKVEESHFSGDKTEESQISRNEFETPQISENEVNLEAKRLINIPRSWNNFIIDGAPIGGTGYATYRLRVKLPENNKHMAIEIQGISTAHKLWVNGELLSSDGKVSSTKEESEAKYYHKVIPLKQNGVTLEFVLQVSNFMHRRGGMWQPIKIGNSDDILKGREAQVIIDLALFGSLFIMALYHLVLFALRRKEKAALYFGVFCFLISLRNLIVGEIIILYFFPQIKQELILKIEYLTFYLGIAFFCLFIHSLFPKQVPEKVVTATTAIGLGSSIVVLATEAIFYSRLLIYYQVYTIIICAYLIIALIIAASKKQESALIVLFGAFAFIAAAINDIFYFNEKLFTGNLAPFGLFIFVFAQSFVISSRFSKAFNTVEYMSERLISMDKLKDEFLANITHELLTPLTGMIGISESIIENESHI